jgi:hypothetical protein
LNQLFPLSCLVALWKAIGSLNSYCANHTASYQKEEFRSNNRPG